jgi:hypothetical protein
MDTETIAFCVNGHYQGGFALLCATDHRLLLVDKKPMNYLTVEDVRFEMISEFDYSHRLLDASIRICTATKTLTFTSWNQQRLRALLSYVQQRVIEIRQYYYLAQQFQTMASQQMPKRSTYVPNLAYQADGGATSQTGSVSSAMGVRLPHFKKHRNTKQLGTYAVHPDDVYQATSQEFQSWLN